MVKNNLAITLYQSNIEGELVEKLSNQEKNQKWFNNKRRRLHSYFCSYTTH